MQQRHGGTLIYQTHDEDGALEVVECFGIRALHFGTAPRQSALNLEHPQRLELPYIRAMLSPLLFTPPPQQALLLGLGGGSLAKFLLEHYPHCRVDAVERRARVVDIAHDFFGLPRTQRLHVTVGDACQQVAERTVQTPATYDLLLVDVYDPVGMDTSINTLAFVNGCAALLKPHGVLAMNLWGTHAVILRESIRLLKQAFPQRALRLPVLNRGNIIGLGLGSQLDPGNLKRLHSHARQLEYLTGVEMGYLLRNLRVIP